MTTNSTTFVNQVTPIVANWLNDIDAAIFEENICVDRYGAVGDGTTDDTTAIQSALTDFAGKTITFKPGSTYVCANLSVPANTTLFLNGATLKLKQLATTVGSPILTLAGNGITIRGGTFDGNKAVQPSDGYSDSYNSGTNSTGRAYRAAITAVSKTDIKIQNCHFLNTQGAAIATNNCTRVSITDNTCVNLNFELAFIANTGAGQTDIVVSRNRGYNFASADSSVNANAILVTQADRILITDNMLYNCERSHIKVEGGNGIVINNNVLDTNTLSDFPAITIQQNAATNYSIVGNTLRNVRAGMYLTAPTQTGGTVANNTINTTNGTSAADAFQFVANTGGLNDIVISGNVARDIKHYGIYLASTCTRVKIADNVLYGQGGSTQVGIQLPGVAGTSNDISILNNHLAHFVEGSANDGVITNATTHVHVNLIIRGNTILAGGATNRALFLNYGTNLISGIVENNYIDGVSLGNHSGIQNGFNTVTGTNTLGSTTTNKVVGLQSGLSVYQGTGSPEAVVTAPVGSLFLRTDGGASTTLYVKTSGTGNTGWTAK